MSGYLLLDAAEYQLEAIVDYTRKRWGEAQAERYLDGLIARFGQIAARSLPWRAIPAEFEVDGYFTRYERHLIYWRVLPEGTIGIAAILHERMHRATRLAEAFAGPGEP
ncbi:type II toxin-antitoxin system RelE/ParE family toxin [Sphingomonas canadensis]|uniref:Type II toxin-antitoxin system RelE/ParE family toxin n=1 Tax=Sphingomonas canadensis TaxID=1219257 RepID=A0ABW3H4Y5_9SPHN|nr:type II toxin-antitoxin system RelE/ParE family toxin [Sphingomonas canadensis]MCW3836240.1 type II toxin-antitoxin system RelE/ParE family toxin [Sphingomonas canadensis]